MEGIAETSLYGEKRRIFRNRLGSLIVSVLNFDAARQMAATLNNQKKATTMNLRGVLALLMGKLRVYLSISISR